MTGCEDNEQITMLCGEHELMDDYPSGIQWKHVRTSSTPVAP